MACQKSRLTQKSVRWLAQISNLAHASQKDPYPVFIGHYGFHYFNLQISTFFGKTGHRLVACQKLSVTQKSVTLADWLSRSKFKLGAHYRIGLRKSPISSCDWILWFLLFQPTNLHFFMRMGHRLVACQILGWTQKSVALWLAVSLQLGWDFQESPYPVLIGYYGFYYFGLQSRIISPKWATDWWLAKIWDYPKKGQDCEIQDCNLIYPFEKYGFLVLKQHYGFLTFLLGTYRSEFRVVFASALVHAETHESVVALEPGDGVADHVDKGRLMHRVS